jgi:hypothetical protein
MPQVWLPNYTVELGRRGLRNISIVLVKEGKLHGMPQRTIGFMQELQIHLLTLFGAFPPAFLMPVRRQELQSQIPRISGDGITSKMSQQALRMTWLRFCPQQWSPQWAKPQICSEQSGPLPRKEPLLPNGD